MFAQREYQTHDLIRIHDARRAGGQRILYTLPTGAGKTVVAALLAQVAHKQGERILFLVHRRELVRQAFDTLTAALPNAAIGIIAAGQPETPDAALQVASVQTLIRRQIDAPDMVFVDEAHHVRAQTWETLLAQWPDACYVGLTATPARTDGKGLHTHFDELLLGPGIAELVSDGYLAPVRQLVPPIDEVVRWRGDDSQITVADAIKAYQEHTPGQRAIFFGWDIEHSKDVAAQFNREGISSEHVDAQTPTATRDEIMASFAPA